MTVDGLHLPARLIALLENGHWPRTQAEANGADASRAFRSKTFVGRIAPDEWYLSLYPPPFDTVQARLTGAEEDFWRRHGALSEIDPGLALLIGDFGLGSDTPIILDYREVSEEPCVLRLRWRDDGADNHWIMVAPNFNRFADILELEGQRWCQ